MGFLRNLLKGKGPTVKVVPNERAIKEREEMQQRKGYDYLKSLIDASSNEINIDSDIKYMSSYELFRERQNIEYGLTDTSLIKDEEVHPILIDKDNITIDGHGHTLNTEQRSGVFIIKAKNVTLKNFIFENANSKEEHTIQITGKSSCNVINCKGGSFLIDDESYCTVGDDVFSNNFGDFLLKNGSSCIIATGDSSNNSVASVSVGEGCFCKANNVKIGKVSNGGKVELSSCLNSKIYNTGEMKIESCQVSDYKSKYHASVENMGEMEICDSTFKNNTNEETGGAIYNTANLKISKSIFISNASNNGGAIASSGEILIDECTFESNRIMTHGLGGALTLDGKSTIKNCTFKYNNSPYNAGAIANGGQMKILDSKFIENRSSFNAGAILSAKKLEIRRTDFEDNYSTNGGVIVNQGELNVFECNFSKNKAKESAGVLLNSNSVVVTIRNSIFRENSARDGLLMFNRMGDINFIECQILNHDILPVDEIEFKEDERQNLEGLDDLMEKLRSIDQSLVDFDSKTLQAHDLVSNEMIPVNAFSEEISISSNNDLKIDEMPVPKFGNLIANEDILKISATTVKENHASTLILNNENAILNLSGGEFLDNETQEAGIFNVGESFSIDGTSFNFNRCNKEGISNIFNGKTLTVINPRIKDNNPSVLNVGTILIKKDTVNFLENVNNLGNIRLRNVFEEESEAPEEFKSFNFSYLDNLIHSNSNGLVTFEQDIELDEWELDFFEGGIELDIDDMTIDGKGNAISGNNLSRVFIITGKNITLKNIVFKEGFLHRSYVDFERGGGAILSNSSSDVKIENCCFIGNDSELWGGAIHNQGAMELHHDKFIRNTANRDGAIRNRRGLLKIFNCEFKNNSSEHYGGALSNMDELEIYDSKFFQNCTKHFGGAILNESNLLIKSTTFRENFQSEKHMGQSSAGGGAIININDENGLLKIEDCKFIKNTTHYYGGAIHSKSGNVIIKNTEFNENDARQGGALYNASSHIKMSFSSFRDNNASRGGAISEIRLIAGNEGLMILDDDLIEINDCTFENNTPDDRYRD